MMDGQCYARHDEISAKMIIVNRIKYPDNCTKHKNVKWCVLQRERVLMSLSKHLVQFLSSRKNILALRGVAWRGVSFRFNLKIYRTELESK